MNSINVQARLDICTIATLAKAYAGEGVLIRSKSDLVWKAIEQLASMYISTGSQQFTDVYEALEYMNSIGLYLDSSRRTTRQVQSAQVNQNAISDFGYENFGAKVTKRGLVKAAQSEEAMLKELYNEAVKHGYKDSWEEYKAKMENATPAPEGVVRETSNPTEMERRERERLTAEKAAYDPTALRAAISPTVVKNIP